MLDAITIRGARQHNLKGFDLAIPHRRLVVVTGVSGSGKSSLAFDTIYAEGQRRYVESLSTYARQFLDRMDKPDVESIDGIAPAIAIEQKNPVKHSRSTVGTATEIATYLRLLYAKIGRIVCPDCDRPVAADTVRSATDALLAEAAGARVLVAFEKPRLKKETWAQWAAARVAQGYLRVVLDGEPVDLGDAGALERIEAARTRLVVADRLVVGPEAQGRLAEALEAAFREGLGAATAVVLGEGPPRLRRFSTRHGCPGCGRTFEAPTPLLFSFNSPRGACPTCKGFGSTLDYDMNRIVPDRTKSLKFGAIDPWTKPSNDWWQKELPAFCKRAGIDASKPFTALTAEEVAKLRAGDRKFPGLDGFFAYLERKKYKMHVRVFMSRYKAAVTCADCGGTRLRPEARLAKVAGRDIAEVSTLTVAEARQWFAALPLTPFEAEVARDVLRQITSRLDFLAEVGLDYLTLDRQTRTLSGGEAQRINLANQLGAALTGTLYVLDEPSVGLHPRDTQKLVGILRKLADAGNSVLVVEHDREVIEAADHVVELGPRSGEAGGEVVFSGSGAAFRGDPHALTSKYLRGELSVPLPRRRRDVDGPRIILSGARAHNLKGITVEVPLGTLTAVTGVSGSGKSTLVHDTLWAAVDRLVNGARAHRAAAEGEENGEAAAPATVGAFDRLSGVERLRGAVMVDQSPIGRTPRSNPATYIKVWDEIRKVFAGTAEARRLGLTAGHFSFNVPGGRCPTCEGAGYQTIEMHFLADVYVTCEGCRGRRFGETALAARYRGRSIADVLGMTVSEAARLFADQAAIARKLRVLVDVGLGYLRLGQAATTLSGGEAQRLKLARELAAAESGETDRVLYVMDEPTTGLHLDDVARLVGVMQALVDRGHTVLVVEHHPDVIKAADWVIDLGPEGGDRGGEVVAVGSPEEIAANPRSHTGRALRPYLTGPDGGAALTGRMRA
ncbi:MAG TPA: excinuclease ABC subunit UvrA [Thermodesulfobacteriota bacterium]